MSIEDTRWKAHQLQQYDPLDIYFPWLIEPCIINGRLEVLTLALRRLPFPGQVA